MTTQPPPQRPLGPYEQSLIESRASRKALEARLAASRRRRRAAAIVAAVALIGGAGAGVAWWQARDTTQSAPNAAGPAGKQCTSTVPVTLWAAPTMQPAAVALAKAFQAQPGSPCVDYQVIARRPIEAMIGMGQGQLARPDAWIPDSPMWVDRVNQAAGLNAKAAGSFAKSPLVIAMDPAEAAKFDTQPEWLELVASAHRIRISDPRSTTAGMLAIASALPTLSAEAARGVMSGLAKTTATSTDKLFADYNQKPADTPAFPVSEADLIEHNRINPDHKMVSVVPANGTAAFEYSLVNVATDPSKSHGIEEMRAFLKTPQAAKILASFGLRSTAAPVTMPTPEGSVGEIKLGASPSLAQVTAATDLWQSTTTPFSLLGVFDVSGSMNEPVGNTTRAAVTQEAAGIVLKALPPTTRAALWVFSIDKGGPGKDYKELVPYGMLSDDTQRSKLAKAAGSLSQEVEGDTGLYDTIWAAYQHAKANWQKGSVNAVVILTDGKNTDPNGISLEQLKANLRAASDPKKPIAITTIGIGPGADPAALSQISKLTYSEYYGAPNPADMTSVLARALFDHECKNGTCV